MSIVPLRAHAGSPHAWWRIGLFLLALLPLRSHAQVMDMSGPFVVSGIVIEGNRVTKERIILRELTLHEGDTVGTQDLYARLERSRQNLMNLGLFNTAALLPTFLGPHEVFLTITVNERWFWWPTPIFQFADPNFNTWWLTRDLRRVNFGAYIYRYNVRGMNETLYAKVQFGYAREFALRYRFPFIDRRQRWGLSVGGGYAEQEEITIATMGNKRVLLKMPQDDIRNVRRADVQASLRPAFDLRHVWRLSWTDARVRDTVVERMPDYFAGARTRMAYLGLGYSFILDQRDSRVFPLKGLYGELSVDRYGLGFGRPGEPDVTTVYGTVQRAWRRGERWSIGGSLRGKTSLGDGIPYYVQEGLGYDEYIRGYEYYILDGQHYALGKANVLFALLKPREYRMEVLPLEPFRTLYVAVYLNAFADVGHVWDDRYAAVNPLSNTWQEGYGIGLDLVSSYDQVLRLEYAVNARSETGFYLHFSQPF